MKSRCKLKRRIIKGGSNSDKNVIGNYTKYLGNTYNYTRKYLGNAYNFTKNYLGTSYNSTRNYLGTSYNSTRNYLGTSYNSTRNYLGTSYNSTIKGIENTFRVDEPQPVPQPAPKHDPKRVPKPAPQHDPKRETQGIKHPHISVYQQPRAHVHQPQNTDTLTVKSPPVNFIPNINPNWLQEYTKHINPLKFERYIQGSYYGPGDYDEGRTQTYNDLYAYFNSYDFGKYTDLMNHIFKTVLYFIGNLKDEFKQYNDAYKHKIDSYIVTICKKVYENTLEKGELLIFINDTYYEMIEALSQYSKIEKKDINMYNTTFNKIFEKLKSEYFEIIKETMIGYVEKSSNKLRVAKSNYTYMELLNKLFLCASHVLHNSSGLTYNQKLFSLMKNLDNSSNFNPDTAEIKEIKQILNGNPKLKMNEDKFINTEIAVEYVKSTIIKMFDDRINNEFKDVNTQKFHILVEKYRKRVGNVINQNKNTHNSGSYLYNLARYVPYQFKYYLTKLAKYKSKQIIIPLQKAKELCITASKTQEYIDIYYANIKLDEAKHIVNDTLSELLKHIGIYIKKNTLNSNRPVTYRTKYPILTGMFVGFMNVIYVSSFMFLALVLIPMVCLIF